MSATRYELRAAGRADTTAILAINRDGVPGVGALGASDVERFLEESVFFRVAVRAGVVVAYLIGLGSEAAYDGEEFAWFGRRFPDFVYVDQVAVSGTARGAGAASALYSGLEAFAARRGSPLLTLEVNLRPENRPSLIFHERRGFQEIGTLETADGRLVSLRTKTIEPGV